MSRAPVRLVSSCPDPAPRAPANRGFAPGGGRGRGREAGRAPAPLPDPVRWRGMMPAVWQAWLLGRWGNDPHRVGAVFGVRTQTARNWLEGLHAPTGGAASWAMMRPDWRAEILAAALRLGVAG